MLNRVTTPTRRYPALRLAALAASSFGLVGGPLILSSAAPASAAESHQDCVIMAPDGSISVTPSCSETVTYQGGLETQPDSVNPCTDDVGTLSILYRQNTFHANVNAAGDFWVTGTENGTVSFAPYDSSAPSGSGPMATWFNFNDNNRNGNSTFTFDVEVHLTNGQIVGVHEVGHMNIDSNGQVTLYFDKSTLTCG